MSSYKKHWPTSRGTQKSIPKVSGLNRDTFKDKYKNYKQTIAIAKNDHGKILVGYSPMDWVKFFWTVVTGGKSFVNFYDDDKLRICT